MKTRPVFDLVINGRKVRLGERTILMGVLNLTPDSFSDGGLYFRCDQAVERGLELARQGADWIDVGGESTRPGARPVLAQEEVRRVLPVIRELRQELRAVPISIDTTKAEVAEQAVRAGASVINDVSGLRFDAGVAEVARRYRAPLILMHLRGRPETMSQPPFARSIWRSLRDGLGRSIRRATNLGVRHAQLIIDPGFGFGKTRRQNFEILAHLERLQRFNLPMLVGTSRKSFVQAIAAGEGLDARRSQRRAAANWALIRKTVASSVRPRQGAALTYLNLGDAAAVVAAILAGAHIVRVHDVGAILPAARIADAILSACGSPC